MPLRLRDLLPPRPSLVPWDPDTEGRAEAGRPRLPRLCLVLRRLFNYCPPCPAAAAGAVPPRPTPARAASRGPLLPEANSDSLLACLRFSLASLRSFLAE